MPDEIEPDGAPNKYGKPRSTSHSNIWYHLALAHFVRGDYAKAAEFYRDSLKIWEEASEKPSQDYDIVVSNYADLLRSLGQVRKAHQLEVRARKRRSS